METVSIDMNNAAQLSAAASSEMLFQMGLMYGLGRGVERNNIAAHKWFNIAAAQGCPSARDERAALALEMSRADIVEAQKQARAWSRTQLH